MQATRWNNAATLFVFAIGLSLALLRMPGAEFIQNSLWAEDGRMFYRWAINRPLESFITPYASYLHLYPRVMAYIATWFDFSLMPYLYFMAWLLAASLTIYVIAKASLNKNNVAISAAIVATIMLQPSSGEIFYSLTNSQWFICVAMCIWALNADKNIPSNTELFLFTIGALTGPFIIILMPALILRSFILKDLKKRWAVYLIAFICMAIQIGLVFFADRHSPGAISTDPSAWLKAALIFLTFGEYPRSAEMAYLAAAFWVAMVVSTLKSTLDKEQLFRVIAISGTGLLLFAAGLLATRNDPMSLHPLGGAARYYFPAYSLIIFAAFMATKDHHILRAIVLAIPFAIGVHSFSTIERPNLNWPAYAAFAKLIPGVHIPENPVDPSYPGWGFSMSERLINGANIPPETQPTLVTVNNGNPTVSIPDSCKHSYVGIDAEIEKSNAGWVQVSVISDEGQESSKSYYNDGLTRFFFATQKTDTRKITVMNLSGGSIALSKIKLYCIDK